MNSAKIPTARLILQGKWSDEMEAMLRERESLPEDDPRRAVIFDKLREAVRKADGRDGAELIGKPVEDWTEQDFVELKKVRFLLSSKLASSGFYLFPIAEGTTHGRTGWASEATTDAAKIKEWIKRGSYLVCVAKRGKCAILDLDDLDACKRIGFDEGWLDGVLKVQSPSGPGHLHAYFPWDPAFDVLPTRAKIDVPDPQGRLIAEMKLNNACVAAPGSMRFDHTGKKREGAYLPLTDQPPGPCRHAAEIVAWLKAHSEKPKLARHAAKMKWEFHPDFDHADLLEWNQCSSLANNEGEGEGWLAIGDGGKAYCVVPDHCPLCDKEARKHTTLAAAVTKFIFGGNGYGFVCHHCQVDTRVEFEEKMGEAFDDWEPWQGFIYRHDDEGLLSSDAAEAGLGVVAVGQEEDKSDCAMEPVAGEPKPAELSVTAQPDARSKPCAAESPSSDAQRIVNKDWWEKTACNLDLVRSPKRFDGQGKPYHEDRHVVEEETLQLALKVLGKKAEMLYDAYPYLFLRDECRIVPLNDDSEAYKLLGRLHLRATQPHSKLVLENLRLHILNEGRKAEIQKWGCFRDGNVYVNNGRGNMFRITPDAIEEVLNGADGVYMHDPEAMPWPRLNESRGNLEEIVESLGPFGMKVTDTPLCRYLNAFFEPQTLQPAQYQQLFLCRYLGLFLRGAFDLLPVCLATGEQGSGKTTLFEKVMWLAQGAGYESEGMPKDLRGFLAALTNSHAAIFDNIDGKDLKEENYVDYICKASTGGVVRFAELYKTNVARTYRLRCDQFYTSRVSPWPDDRTDVGRRTLDFPIRKPLPQEAMTRDSIRRYAVKERDALLFETLARLRLVAKALADARCVRHVPVTEMAEFEDFTMRVAEHEGWSREMAAIWTGYMGDSRAHSAEDSPLVGAVRLWLGCRTPDGVHPNLERWAKSGEIFTPVKKVLGRELPWKSSSTFGKAMKTHLSALRILGMETKFLDGARLYRFSPPEVELEKCRSTFDSSAGRHMMLPDPDEESAKALASGVW